MNASALKRKKHVEQLYHETVNSTNVGEGYDNKLLLFDLSGSWWIKQVLFFLFDAIKQLTVKMVGMCEYLSAVLELNSCCTLKPKTIWKDTF